jgi:hypothetical protein
MSNQEALNDLIQRFAVSALSRERKHEALNEEILVGKYTGEFYIKTKDGIVLSADIMNRAKATMNDAIRVAELMGMTGDLYRIDFENMQLPCNIGHGDNIIQGEELQIPVDTKEILLYLDVDEYDIEGDKATPVYSKGGVKILLEVTIDGQIQYERLDSDLLNINATKFSVNIEGASSVRIINVTINKEDKVYTTSNAERALLLHNMYITINN